MRKHIISRAMVLYTNGRMKYTYIQNTPVTWPWEESFPLTSVSCTWRVGILILRSKTSPPSGTSTLHLVTSMKPCSQLLGLSGSRI